MLRIFTRILNVSGYASAAKRGDDVEIRTNFGIAPSSRGYPPVRARVVLRWSRGCMGRACSASFAALAAETPRRGGRGEAGKSQRREEDNALEPTSDG